MKVVLDTLTTGLSDNYKVCLENLKPLTVLFPSLKPLDNDAQNVICELSKLCPRGLLDDNHALETEFDISVISRSKDEPETMQKRQHVAELQCKLRHVFPVVDRAYNLALCVPVSLAKNEQSFSRLKNCQESLTKQVRR